MKIKILHKAWVQLINMLSDRGYDISNYLDETDRPLRYEDFVKEFIEDDDTINISMEVYKIEDETPLWAQYLIDRNDANKKVGKDIVQNTMYKEMIERNIYNGIILTQTGVTTPTAKHFTHLRFNIEIFTVTNMIRNPITHNSAPKYEIITDKDEMEDIIYGSNVTEDTYIDLFPAMSINDPVSRWYDLKEGDIIKIIKKYPKNMVSYRVVRRLTNVPDRLEFS